MFEQPSRGTAPPLGDLFEPAPASIEADMQGFRVAGTPDGQAAAAIRAVPAVTGQTGDDLAQVLWQGLRLPAVLDPLGEQAQVERIAFAGDDVGCGFAECGDEGLFKFAGLVEALLRRTFDSDVDEGGHPSVVA